MVEILVAITLFGLLSAATVPLLITAIRASVVAKLDTGAKNLSQQRFEAMRNLPFRIAYDPLVSTSRDVLDQYYPNLSPPVGGVNSNGYVTTQARRTGEPPAGPFYRSTFSIGLGSTTYHQYVATQFLVPDTKAPIAPTAPYDAFSLNDLAPTGLIGITVVTEWSIGNLSKRYTVYSQLNDVAAGPPLLTLQARVSALKATTTLGSTSTTDLALEVGVVNLDGGISSGTTAAVSTVGGYVSLTPGSRSDGARLTASAPGDVPGASITDNNSHSVYDSSGNLLATVPKTDVANVGARTSGGLPVVATAASPAQASAYGSVDLKFGNRPNLADSSLGLDPSLAVIRQPANSSTLQARSTAYATSVAGTTHSGTVSMSAETSVVRVLPTNFAPEGLVQMQLISSSLTCFSSGATITSTPAYTAQVRLWKFIPTNLANPLSGGTSGYTTWQPLSSTQATDPLASVSLATDSTGTAVTINNGRVVYLGEYVKSLSSQTATTLTATQALTKSGRGTDTRIPSMLSLSTVPLRAGEDLSSVNLQLGVMTCGAEDNR